MDLSLVLRAAVGGRFQMETSCKDWEIISLVEIKAWLWCAGYTHEKSVRKSPAGILLLAGWE